MAFSLNQPVVFSGESENGDWYAEYVPMKSYKELWQGNLVWEGEGQPEVLELAFKLNNELFDLSLSDLKMDSGKLSELPSLSSKHLSDTDPTYFIKWKDEKGESEEIISLQPKKRFFVIPRIFYGNN